MIDIPPSKYSYKTRIGNWSEEWELDETKLKDFKHTQENGDMMNLDSEKKKALTVRKAALSYLPCSELQSGARVMLRNTLVGGNLACNIWDRVSNEQDSYGVACSLDHSPMVRNVFCMVKVPGQVSRGGNYNQIRYGDKIYIMASDRLFGRQRDFYLMSQYTTTQSFARNTHFQEVTISSRQTGLTTWVLEHINPTVRFESIGQPVLAGEEILIKHSHTGKWLGTDNILVKTMYGTEMEVFTESYMKKGKSQNLSKELEGKITIDTPMRSQEPQNSWVVISAQSPNDDFDERESDKPIQINDVLDSLKKALKLKGSYGLAGLRLMFKKIDYNGNGSLDEDDIRWGFRNYGVNLLDSEVKLLVSAFDRNSNGALEYEEFLGVMNVVLTINKVLHKPEKNQYDSSEKLAGKITLENLGKIFDATKHPDVIDRKKTEEEVFDAFIKNWGQIDPFTVISLQEFTTYFGDLSSCIDKEDYFEKLLKFPFNIIIN